MTTRRRLATPRPVLSVSIPAGQREAFYAALMRLREHDDQPFPTVSALIVHAVLTAAQTTACSPTSVPSAPTSGVTEWRA